MGIDGVPHSFVNVEDSLSYLKRRLFEILKSKKELVFKLEKEEDEGAQIKINQELEVLEVEEKEIIEKLKIFNEGKTLIDEKSQ